MTPIRNRWFERRTLTAEDLEREADYLIGHRRLTHRMLHGHGVVWGLDAEVAGGAVTVHPGFAIDGWGRELVVTCVTDPVPLPSGLGDRVEVVLCYGEQERDPVPSRGEMEPSTVHEVPRVEVRAAGPRATPSLLPSGALDRETLVRWITTGSIGSLPHRPDVVLAEIGPEGVDVTVRSVVVSNAVLLELLLRLDR